MTDTHHILTRAGMAFTSEMATSATHELKNKLGIMNENAGLIQDLFYLERQGRAIDTARIEAISHKIQDQIRLADVIIKRLNGLVHTMDLSRQTADLESTLRDVLALADRRIEKKQCHITVLPPAAPIIAAGNPFCLQNLLWTVLRGACDTEDGGGSVRISFEKKKKRPAVLFVIEGGEDRDWEKVLGSEDLTVLAEYLKIEARVLEENNGVGLFWSNSNE